ncbi:hypothetical protein HK102_003506 [Quaeritorhiza haematococci]|nr:hypothetical protein HK102_003506 [Quaeritorhiza haematococci]
MAFVPIHSDHNIGIAQAGTANTNRIGCVVFWDHENVSVPQRCTGHVAVNAIKSFLKYRGQHQQQPQQVSVKKIILVAKMESLVERLRVDLQASGVKMLDSASRKTGSSDLDILVEIMEFIYNTRPPHQICIISGDRDFSKCIAFLRSVGYEVILIHGKQASDVLISVADDAIEWDFLLWTYGGYVGGGASGSGLSLSPQIQHPRTPAIGGSSGPISRIPGVGSSNLSNVNLTPYTTVSGRTSTGLGLTHLSHDYAITSVSGVPGEYEQLGAARRTAHTAGYLPQQQQIKTSARSRAVVSVNVPSNTMRRNAPVQSSLQSSTGSAARVIKQPQQQQQRQRPQQPRHSAASRSRSPKRPIDSGSSLSQNVVTAATREVTLSTSPLQRASVKPLKRQQRQGQPEKPYQQSSSPETTATTSVRQNGSTEPSDDNLQPVQDEENVSRPSGEHSASEPSDALTMTDSSTASTLATASTTLPEPPATSEIEVHEDSLESAASLSLFTKFKNRAIDVVKRWSPLSLGAGDGFDVDEDETEEEFHSDDVADDDEMHANDEVEAINTSDISGVAGTEHLGPEAPVDDTDENDDADGEREKRENDEHVSSLLHVGTGAPAQTAIIVDVGKAYADDVSPRGRELQTILHVDENAFDHALEERKAAGSTSVDGHVNREIDIFGSPAVVAGEHLLIKQQRSSYSEDGPLLPVQSSIPITTRTSSDTTPTVRPNVISAYHANPISIPFTNTEGDAYNILKRSNNSDLWNRSMPIDVYGQRRHQGQQDLHQQPSGSASSQQSLDLLIKRAIVAKYSASISDASGSDVDCNGGVGPMSPSMSKVAPSSSPVMSNDPNVVVSSSLQDDRTQHAQNGSRKPIMVGKVNHHENDESARTSDNRKSNQTAQPRLSSEMRHSLPASIAIPPDHYIPLLRSLRATLRTSPHTFVPPSSSPHDRRPVLPAQLLLAPGSNVALEEMGYESLWACLSAAQSLGLIQLTHPSDADISNLDSDAITDLLTLMKIEAEEEEDSAVLNKMYVEVTHRGLDLLAQYRHQPVDKVEQAKNCVVAGVVSVVLDAASSTHSLKGKGELREAKTPRSHSNNTASLTKIQQEVKSAEMVVASFVNVVKLWVRSVATPVDVVALELDDDVFASSSSSPSSPAHFGRSGIRRICLPYGILLTSLCKSFPALTADDAQALAEDARRAGVIKIASFEYHKALVWNLEKVVGFEADKPPNAGKDMHDAYPIELSLNSLNELGNECDEGLVRRLSQNMDSTVVGLHPQLDHVLQFYVNLLIQSISETDFEDQREDATQVHSEQGRVYSTSFGDEQPQQQLLHEAGSPQEDLGTGGEEDEVRADRNTHQNEVNEDDDMEERVVFARPIGRKHGSAQLKSTSRVSTITGADEENGAEEPCSHRDQNASVNAHMTTAMDAPMEEWTNPDVFEHLIRAIKILEMAMLGVTGTDEGRQQKSVTLQNLDFLLKGSHLELGFTNLKEYVHAGEKAGVVKILNVGNKGGNGNGSDEDLKVTLASDGAF